jgi:membrane protein DedA with SNARE-associated domain
MEQLAFFLTRYAYWGLLVSIVAENLGLPLPGEILILLAAAMANQAGLSLSGIIWVAALGAILGDGGSYLIGRRGGRQLLNAYCHATLCSRDCGLMAGRFFQRFGIWAVTLARFVPGLRAFAAPFAGMSRMAYGKFLVADSIGAILWAVIVTALGARFGPALTEILGRVMRFGAITFVVLALALAFTLIIRLRKVRKQGFLTVSEKTSQ